MEWPQPNSTKHYSKKKEGVILMVPKTMSLFECIYIQNTCVIVIAVVNCLHYKIRSGFKKRSNMWLIIRNENIIIFGHLSRALIQMAMNEVALLFQVIVCLLQGVPRNHCLSH